MYSLSLEGWSLGFILDTELGWVSLQKQENHSVGIFFSFLFWCQKTVNKHSWGINFKGVISPHHLPEFSSRSSHLGALHWAPEEAGGWRKGIKGLPKWSAKPRQCHGKGSAGWLPQAPPSRTCSLSLGDCCCPAAVVELVGSRGVELVQCREKLVIWGVRRAGLFSHFSGTIIGTAVAEEEGKECYWCRVTDKIKSVAVLASCICCLG